jgi:CRP/FNR family transcriptional regulator
VKAVETDESILGYLDSLFPSFEPGLKKILSESARLRRVSAGEQLIRPGQYFQSTMLVVEGRIKLYREGEDGNEFFIYFLEPGNACALSMICATRHETSQVLAEAAEDSLLIQIPLGMMDTLMRDYRSWYYFVLETYRSRFEEVLHVIDSIAFKSMDERLEFHLRRHAEQYKSRQLNLTHQQIADDLNSSREVISRLLKKMEKDGKLVLNRNSIELLDTAS